jgi:hypothetical protein
MEADRLELVCRHALRVDKLTVKDVLMGIEQESLAMLILDLLQVLDLRVVVQRHFLTLAAHHLFIFFFCCFQLVFLFFLRSYNLWRYDRDHLRFRLLHWQFLDFRQRLIVGQFDLDRLTMLHCGLQSLRIRCCGSWGCNLLLDGRVCDRCAGCLSVGRSTFELTGRWLESCARWHSTCMMLIVPGLLIHFYYLVELWLRLNCVFH